MEHAHRLPRPSLSPFPLPSSSHRLLSRSLCYSTSLEPPSSEFLKPSCHETLAPPTTHTRSTHPHDAQMQTHYLETTPKPSTNRTCMHKPSVYLYRIHHREEGNDLDFKIRNSNLKLRI